MAETVIGNYRILSEIGQGACGHVYLAQHTVLENRSVALKLMHNIPLHEHQEKNLFLQESHMLEILRHPYILPIVDAGVNEGLPYIVTEYAPNGSLRQLLRLHDDQPLPQEKALSILAQIGSALQYAHEQQVVHRDLKPENILFNAQENALLADFGLAVTLSSMSMHVTTEAGTPAYMAPEQFQGVASREGDQYALGCIAYELFTGHRVFTAPNIASMMYSHLHTDPTRPSEYNPDIALHIEQAILKALAKNRHDRHVNIAAFLIALAAPSLEAEIATYRSPVAIHNSDTKTFSQNSTLPPAMATSMETQLLVPKPHSTLSTKVLVDRDENKQSSTQHTQLIGKKPVAGRRFHLNRRLLFVALACVVALAAIVTPFLFQVQPSGTKGILAVAPPGLNTTPSTQPTPHGMRTHTTGRTTQATTNVSSQSGAAVGGTTTPTATGTAMPTTTATGTATSPVTATPIATSTDIPVTIPTSTPTPAPRVTALTLVASPASYAAAKDCTWQAAENGQHGGGTWSCAATLQNPAGTQKILNWSASSSGINKNTTSLTFSQTSGTLSPGQTTTVDFSVSLFFGSSCTSDVQNVIVAFAGPQNTIYSPWRCTAPTYTVSPLNTTTKNCQLVSGRWQCLGTVTMYSQGQVYFSAGSSNGNFTISPYPTTALLSSPNGMSSQFTVSVPATACPVTFEITYYGGDSGNTIGSFTC